MTNIEPAQIVRSAQVWVCETCGGQDHKSCGCNSTARMEELAAKREAHRQAARKHREQKVKENQSPRDNHADVENIEETPEASADAMRVQFAEMDDAAIETEHQEGLRVIAARGFRHRAKEAQKLATVGEIHPSDVTEDLIEEADDAASAWKMAAQQLRRLKYGEGAKQ